jgi:hypothetical protein
MVCYVHMVLEVSAIDIVIQVGYNSSDATAACLGLCLCLWLSMLHHSTMAVKLPPSVWTQKGLCFLSPLFVAMCTTRS